MPPDERPSDEDKARKAAEEIADKADDCCNRHGEWWQGIYDLALRHLLAAERRAKEECANWCARQASALYKLERTNGESPYQEGQRHAFAEAANAIRASHLEESDDR